MLDRTLRSMGVYFLQHKKTVNAVDKMKPFENWNTITTKMKEAFETFGSEFLSITRFDVPPIYLCYGVYMCGVVCGKHHENVSEFNRWHKNSVSWPCLLGFFFHLCLWFLSNRIRPSSNGSLAWYFFRLYCECRSSAIWKLHDEHKTF